MKDILIFAAGLCLFLPVVFLLYRGQAKEFKAVYLAGLGVKLAAGLAYAAVYKFYYSEGDSLMIFEVTVGFLERFAQDPIGFFISQTSDIPFERRLFFPRANNADLNYRLLFLYQIISPFVALGLFNYWLSTLWLSLLGFLGFWKMTKTFCQIWPAYRKAAYAAFLFFPSTVFWSSGINKESVLILALGIYVSELIEFLYGEEKQESKAKKIFRIVQIVFSIIIILNIKYYILAVLLPVSFSLAVSRRIGEKRNWLPFQRAALFILLFTLTVGIGSRLHPNLQFENIMAFVNKNNREILLKTKSANQLDLSRLNSNILSFIDHAPTAFMGAFFRPALPEAGNWFKKWVAFELFIVWISVFFAELYIPKNLRLLFTSMIFYVLFLGMLFAFSGPNIGILVRYRVVWFPFIVYAVARGITAQINQYNYLPDGIKLKDLK